MPCTTGFVLSFWHSIACVSGARIRIDELSAQFWIWPPMHQRLAAQSSKNRPPWE